MCVWDLGGQDKLRHLCATYFKSTQGIIYVIDSSDHERFQEAKEELEKLLKEELRTAAVLILCNKQDIPNAMTVEEISEKLQPMLTSEVGRKFLFQSTCASSGKGLDQGLDWLSKNISWQ